MSSPAIYEVHAAILARALAGPPPEYVTRQIRLERIENRLAQFSPILHQDGKLDEYLCDLIMQSFHAAGTDHTTYEHPRAPLTPTSFPDELIDELIPLRDPTQAIDRQALRDDLQLAFLCFQFDSLITSTGASTKRARLLQQLRSNLRRTQNALRDLAGLGVDLYKYDATLDQTKFGFTDELETLTSLDDFAKQTLDRTPDQPRYKLEQPPIVTLIGVNLPMIFEECFGMQAGRGRDGPYMRFAGKALGAMGLEYTPNTIKTYLVAAKMKRIRRKTRSD